MTRVATARLIHRMDILRKAVKMLSSYALCDHCLGRQLALLGHGIENDERGGAIKLVLEFKAHEAVLSGNQRSLKLLEVLALNGFCETAEQTLGLLGKPLSSKVHRRKCFLCEDTFASCSDLAKMALELLKEYEYSSFLVGVELPVHVAEREDEFKAAFEVDRGESLRNEFGRVVGKIIVESTGKSVDFKRPEVVVLVNPFTGKVRLQVNPLFVGGRYRKLVRDIPQSKWFCSKCRGKGCKQCGWTGKMYPESVQEIVEKPILEAAGGVEASFHASGREDIDARMLGKGRPFVLEVSKPKKRFLNLAKLEEAVNASGKGKVEIIGLRLADREGVRLLKKSEATQKRYRVLVEFEKEVSEEELQALKNALANVVVKQRTPLRVLHRRADLTRERYIYELNVKRLSPKKAEMKIRCQGGLYVKELVTGDEGRTVPSVSEILSNKASPLKLDVLEIVMDK